MVPTSNFSGFVSSTWALARAAAIVPIESLERCMTGLSDHEVETDRPGFRALGANPMAIGFLGVLRHERFEFAFCPLMLNESWLRPAIHGGELGPGVGLTHVHGPHGVDSWPRWLDAKEA